MEGRLQETDKYQLEQWIGEGPKVFTLLYAITRDGCSATTFHQKCDNQGPTVTMLYNSQGSVYGGYNGLKWDSTSIWMNTQNAFLYRLFYNHKSKPVKFSIKSQDTTSQHAIYYYQSYGPTFGGGHDLHTFKGTIPMLNGQFSLNGSMSHFGNTYDTQGISADMINNGSMDVTELEVYTVTGSAGERKKMTEKPWRKTRDWTMQYLNELKENVVAFKPTSGLNVTEVRALMVGPVGAGKSSFFNTIDSIYQERITRAAPSGSAEQSLTAEYIPYKIKPRSGDKLKLRLCDTRGLEESQGLDTVEFNYLLEGNIPGFYKFHSSSPICPKTDGFNNQPSVSDTIHCVVFVLDATSLEVLSKEIVDKIKSFRRLVVVKGIPQLIMLTKIDKVCESVEEDTANVFKSGKVQKHVDNASYMFGLPRADILPVRNYESETELDENTSTLALLSLRKILNYADDYLVHLKDKMDEKSAKKEV